MDTTSPYFVASLWMALALAASVISIRLGLSVALAEIGCGVIYRFTGEGTGKEAASWIRAIEMVAGKQGIR